MPVFTSDQRVAQVAAVGRFRSSHYYSRATSAPAGSTTMTRYCAMFPIKGRVPATTANRMIWCRNAGDGYFVQWTVAGAFAQEYLVRVHDGGGAAVSVEVPMFLAPLRRLIVLAFSYDGTTLRVRTSEGVTGSAAGAGGYTAPAANFFYGIDNLNTFPTLEWALAHFLGTDAAARSDAQMATDITTILENIQNARDLRTSLGFAPSFYWDPADAVPAGGVVAATWTDRVGGLVMTRTGSPEGYGFAARVL